MDADKKKNIGKEIVLTKALNCLKGEYELIRSRTDDKDVMLEEFDVIYKLTKIINDFDELEPVLDKYFREKHQKEKWSDER